MIQMQLFERQFFLTNTDAPGVESEDTSERTVCLPDQREST